jgi:hypothetical protein
LFFGDALGPEFQVVVDKPDDTQPDGAEKHESDIGLVQVGEQEGRDEDGEDDDKAAHGRGAFFVVRLPVPRSRTVSPICFLTR